ncbi:MAG TPA: mechanosensitive ion channel domain-containing protein [Longimicrobiaceae bacterium]|nr:mechanosensitive ion channel domain-containing protein [Longimicrobiaceae bacterium]
MRLANCLGRLVCPIFGLLAFVAPLAAQEVAAVELNGEPVFSVGALAGDSAASAPVRATRISERLASLLDSDKPLSPVRVVQVDDHAAVLVANDTIVTVTQRDAEVSTAEPLPAGAEPEATRRVAVEWATALREALSTASAQERARVVVQGLPLFDVSGTRDLRATTRAASIGIQISELADTPGALPEVSVATRNGQVVVIAGGEVIVEVTPADTAGRELGAIQLAQQWAAEIEQTARTVREQSSGGYLLRVLGLSLLAIFAGGLIHWTLLRIAKRIKPSTSAESSEGWGLAQVVIRWLLGVVRFLAWAGVAVYILWLIPRTRPLTFQIADRAVEFASEAAIWLSGAGLVLILIAAGTFFIARFVSAMVRYLIALFGHRRGGRIGLRAETLAGTAAALSALLVFFLGVVAVLMYLNFDPVPLLAGAGVAGIALGFGVQTLIRDFFTGFFILLEDQYGVGDVIRIGGAVGTVERFTLRITQIRAQDGSLTSIPNGEVLNVTNLSKDWSQAVLDVNIALGEDIDKATEVIALTAKGLADDWGTRIRGEPEVLGVELIDPANRSVSIRVVMRTAPLERWAVAREMRRRILDAFDEAEIEVPPRSVLTFGGGGSDVDAMSTMR